MSGFTITFSDNTENLRIPQYGFPDYKQQPLGTWMLEILNSDIDRLEALTSKFDIPRHPGCIDFTLEGKSYFKDHPTNLREVFAELRDEFSFVRAYAHSEWWQLYSEIISLYGLRCLRDAINDLKRVIDISTEHPEYMNYRFLSRYLLNGILETLASFRVEIHETSWVLSDADEGQIKKMNFEERMAKTYSCFTERDHTSPFHYEYSDISPRLEGIMFATFFELTRRNKVVRKCKNCGRYFIPENRSDTLYCDGPSPEAPEMTCKEYGTRRLWYERLKEDELATLSRKIASAKGMLAKRNPDIPGYAASYNYFKAQRLAWIKAVKEGTKTQDEYKAWLLLMQSQPVIKEACIDPE